MTGRPHRYLASVLNSLSAVLEVAPAATAPLPRQCSMWSWISSRLAFAIRALDGVELLGEFGARAPRFDHADRGGEMAVGAFQTLQDGGVGSMLHAHILRGG